MKTYKLIILGDSGVGKSSLLHQFADGSFVHLPPTLGIDFKVKCMEIGGQKLKLQVWDTAGQERFETINASYYRGAHGVIFAYNMAKRDSFLRVSHWQKQLNNRNCSASVIMVATKCDLEEEREVSKDEGEEYANSCGIHFFETSAKTGQNVELAFRCLAETIQRKQPPEELWEDLQRESWREIQCRPTTIIGNKRDNKCNAC